MRITVTSISNSGSPQSSVRSRLCDEHHRSAFEKAASKCRSKIETQDCPKLQQISVAAAAMKNYTQVSAAAETDEQVQILTLEWVQSQANWCVYCSVGGRVGCCGIAWKAKRQATAKWKAWPIFHTKKKSKRATRRDLILFLLLAFFKFFFFFVFLRLAAWVVQQFVIWAFVSKRCI